LDIEHEGDEITHQVIRRMNTSFVLSRDVVFGEPGVCGGRKSAREEPVLRFLR
jgi:hypothetical protein